MDININIPKENIKFNEPMSKHTTFKIGGNADIFVQAKTLNDIEQTLKAAKENNIPIYIIGNGSNLLVKDNGVRGIVLQIKTSCSIDVFSLEFNFERITKQNDFAIVDVEAGMLNAKLARILLQEGISGFEFASGIPGTIGGAIRMNAGAYGSEFKDFVEETTYIDLEDNEIKTINNKEHEFKYRYSIFQNKKAVIISTKLRLKYGDKQEIKDKMNANLEARKEKQPLEFPNAGSTFKRGEDFITAQLIDQCGLKGAKIGGAEVAEKHAGFIVNKGNATANDVIELVKKVEDEVYNKFGKRIELEIEVIGE